MMEHRRLRGHCAATTCCIASRLRPGLVATAAEDGYVCWFDLRCKDVLFKMDVANGSPVSSLCFKQGNENILYVSTGNEVKCFDVHMAASGKQLESYNYNKDEINQIVFHSKSSFLAAADDAGDVKIIDTQQRSLYNTLRAGRRSCLNPAFIHGLDVVDKIGKICVVARGDGVVSILNIDSELAALKSKSAVKPKLGTESKSTAKGGASPSGSQNQDQNDKELQLDYSMGGHTAAVSSVTFSMFGEKGKFIISGGNDKLIKVWDWSKSFDAGWIGNDKDLLCSSISLSKKVNWLCTTPTDSENLVVCDTSKVVKVYTVE